MGAGETVDEALDMSEALREDEPKGEPAVRSPQGDASFLENTTEGEDMYMEEMYGAPQAQDEVTLRAARETFRFRDRGSSLCATCRKTPSLWPCVLYRIGSRQLHQGLSGDCVRPGALDKHQEVPRCL